MNIAYFGTPYISAIFLEKLLSKGEAGVAVPLVVTQPDKPVGRKKILTPSPVKQVAQKYNVPVYDSPIHLSTLRTLIKNKGIELSLLFAYGEIIKKDLLEAPKYGFWNVHPSLLPRYRGASPVAYPLMMGEGSTGVTLMKMDEKLDHGPIIAQKRIELSPIEIRSSAEERLSHISYKLFCENIAEFMKKKGEYDTLQIQDESQATYTRELSKNDGYISWDLVKKSRHNAPIITADLPNVISEYLAKNNASLPRQKIPVGETLLNLYRALSPWPGIWTRLVIGGREKRLKLTSLSYDFDTKILSINRVQLEGKNEVDFKTFQSAYQIL